MPPYELTTTQDSDNLMMGIYNLNISPVTDKFVIKGASGVAVAHVQKPNGHVYSARVQANGALQQFTQFDANRLSVQERRELESQLHNRDNLTQSEIADLLGVSQATVSNDLKLIRQQNQSDK